MIDIDRPTIDWCAMAKAMGVPIGQRRQCRGFSRRLGPVRAGAGADAHRSATVLSAPEPFFGHERMRRTARIPLANGLAHDQKITPNRMSVDELFDGVTVGLE